MLDSAQKESWAQAIPYIKRNIGQNSAMLGELTPELKLYDLHQLHLLDRLEEDQDKSWECTQMLKYCEEIGMKTSKNHICLVE
jgi:hypothetical protein